jgi:predicted dehydrogenase
MASDTGSTHEPLRVAIIGTAARSSYLYGPLIKGLPSAVQLVGVWGRSEASAQRLGDDLAVPWYTDVDRLIRETSAQVGVVAVTAAANGQVGLMAVEAGLHVLLETPIAQDLDEADAIIAAAGRKQVKIEVAEQFHRRPLEQLKLHLIAGGLFGRVYSSFNDFAGHGYHGVSLMRSYLGFDAVPVQVTGAVVRYDLAPYVSQMRGEVRGGTETQEHGIIEFAGGQVGLFHWTNVGYDSPLRWWRSSRFLAERGMGVTVGVGLDVEERLSLLSPDGQAPLFITVERRWERVDGGALVALIAHTGDPTLPTVRWDSPFAPAVKGHGVQWHDDEIGVAGCLLSLVEAIRTDTSPSYGAAQARLDQEVILAIRRSAEAGGSPVRLPLD